MGGIESGRHGVNAVEIAAYRKMYRKDCIKGWVEDVFPDLYGSNAPYCEICGKKLNWTGSGKRRKETVAWDHKHGPDDIKPSEWLQSHPPTPANIAVWVGFDFGMLCSDCNMYWPTDEKKRRRKLRGAIQYVEKPPLVERLDY